jgi:hypothetical protein
MIEQAGKLRAARGDARAGAQPQTGGNAGVPVAVARERRGEPAGQP